MVAELNKSLNTLEQEKFTTNNRGQTSVRIVDDNNLYKLERREGTNVVYIGENKTQYELETTATWRVSRVLISGNDTITSYVDDGKFTQTFNDPESLFPGIPFVNLYSLDISAGNKRIDVPNNASLNFSNASTFSWNVWFKLENTGMEVILQKALSQRGYKITKESNESIEFEFRGPGGTGDRIRVHTPIMPQIIDAQWHMLTFTYSGSGTAAGFKAYLDGVQKTLNPTQDSLTGDPSNSGILSLGSLSGGGSYFEGFLDEICLWNVEIDQDDVTALYNLGNPIDPTQNSDGYDKSGSLVSYWKFTDEDIADLPTIYDNFGVNNGTGINIVAGNFVTEVAP